MNFIMHLPLILEAVLGAEVCGRKLESDASGTLELGFVGAADCLTPDALGYIRRRDFILLVLDNGRHFVSPQLTAGNTSVSLSLRVRLSVVYAHFIRRVKLITPGGG